MVDGGRRSFLDSIPGWSGYRDRERRRNSDRLLRERLAREYGEIADDLAKLASRLAEDRRLSAIRYVDRPHGRLTHFTDRLKTATYGYAGLFSDRPVDASALDQIAAFDESLGDGIDKIAAAATSLIETDPNDSEFRDRSEELEDMIEDLLDRLDKRADLIETGVARPEEEISALLAATSSQAVPPTAYQLHDGDGITYQGENYTVIGRITIQTAIGGWRDFQLRGGDGLSWLRAPAASGGTFLWSRRVEPDGEPGDPTLDVDQSGYTLDHSIDAVAEVIGSGGASGDREVTVHEYRSRHGSRVLNIYHWRADTISLLGEPIDPVGIELWSREGGRAL